MLNFYKGKRVFVTGHTGFKGSWLCMALTLAGADVTGYALAAEPQSLYNLTNIEGRVRSVIGDIRDLDALNAAFSSADPQIIFHLAAQPIVRDGYKYPVYTYSTNFMGTVNLLECIRLSNKPLSFVNITTDKVYRNQNWPWGYREIDQLGGYDPYASSKSCSEFATQSYKDSFLEQNGTAVSTARAGNVLGGGDFAKDRIIPDCVRAFKAGLPVKLRNPASVRPYQHVLEPICAYLEIAKAQYEDISLADTYNIGPAIEDCITTGKLVEIFCRAWGEGAQWIAESDGGPHEDALLRLDCEKIRTRLNWLPKWDVYGAVRRTADWSKAWIAGEDMEKYTETQVSEYFSGDIGV